MDELETKENPTSISHINLMSEINKSKNKIVLKNYYNFEEINELSPSELFNLLSEMQMITFISNDNFIKKKSICCKNLKPKKFNNCKEILFLSYEFKFRLLEILDNKKSFIAFENGIIKKGIIYKKMIIKNKHCFIPIEKYNYKLTEYKIRGFCQIAEELGANKIEINFSHINSDSKKIKVNINSEIAKIAGNLGFSINSSNNKEQSNKYILQYPDNNNLILNPKKIFENLKNGKYFISVDDYNTNLELQYLINSRCRHFITNYATNFKIKNNNDYNFETINKLKIADIELSNQVTKEEKYSSKIIIQTKIYFNNEYRTPNDLLKYSLSMDEIGFNFIFNNIRKKYNKILTNEWILFLWRFITLYCEFHNKYNNFSESDDSKEMNNKMLGLDFREINESINKIKQNFSLDEITKILKNYFDINSQMINLKNFLLILSYKSKTYDELGFFLIINENKYLKEREKTINILNFIISKEKNNDKIKKFLQVYNSECIYQIYQKFLEFGIFYNWVSLDQIIKNSKLFLLNNILKKESFEEKYKRLYNNYAIGLSTFEFYENITPFIENTLYHFWYKKEQFDIKDIEIIIKSISEESFSFNNVNSYQKLENYLNKKINKFKEILKLTNDLIKQKNISKQSNSEIIKKYIKDNQNKKNFIIKKIFLMYGNKQYEFKITNIRNFLINVLIYNEKINIHHITLDKYGFKKVKINLLAGDFNKCYNKYLENFVLKYFNFNYTDITSCLKDKISQDNFLYKFTKNNIVNLNFNNFITKLIEEIL